MIENQPRNPRIFTLKLYRDYRKKEEAKEDLLETQNLVRSLRWKLIAGEIYYLRNINTHTVIGSGKIQKLKKLFEKLKINLIVIDFSIKSYALKNLEDEFNTIIIDRTRLILEIFHQRATSHAGKLQVSLAEAEYEIGRLRGKGHELSRLGGGIGTRGPGEQIMEKRRRDFKRQIKSLRKKLEKVSSQRNLIYQNWKKQGFTVVSLVGYTNAGKSTLLSSLTQEEITSRNQLFTTLDPTTRKIMIHKKPFLFTDTVGFIRNLPTSLVKGFESTLEQIKQADLILVIVDISDKYAYEKEKVVKKTLDKIEAKQKRITAYNKLDQIKKPLKAQADQIYISALKKDNLPNLLEKVYQACL